MLQRLSWLAQDVFFRSASSRVEVPTFGKQTESRRWGTAGPCRHAKIAGMLIAWSRTFCAWNVKYLHTDFHFTTACLSDTLLSIERSLNSLAPPSTIPAERIEQIPPYGITCNMSDSTP